MRSSAGRERGPRREGFIYARATLYFFSGIVTRFSPHALARARRLAARITALLVMTTSLQTTPREPPFPRAAEIDECVADASSRVKRLHGLLTQWQLADMSQEQSSHLLAYVEEVLQHTRESSSALAAYDETIQQSLGPELCQARDSGIPLPSPVPCWS